MFSTASRNVRSNQAMFQPLVRLATSPPPSEREPRAPWPLYLLSFVADAVALASLAWAGGDIAFAGAVMALGGLGHLIAARWKGRLIRSSLLVLPALVLGIWFMRWELFGLVTGGPVIPLAKLLAVALTAATFGLRTLRALYDSLLLSLGVVLLAGQAALSVQFGAFLAAYGLVAVVFLIVGYASGEAPHARWTASRRARAAMAPLVAVVALTVVAAFGVFTFLPQVYRIHDAAPLPSRLDLTTGARPPSRTGLPSNAPSSRVAPSRSADGGGGQSSDAASSPQPPQPATSTPPATRSGAGAANSGPGPLASGVAGDGGYASLGYVGEDDRNVVMYVRSRVTSYWRGEVFDEYDGKGWRPSGSSPTDLVLDLGGRLRFEDAPPYWPFREVYVQTYYLKTRQPSAVFTGYSPGVIVREDWVGEPPPTAALAESLRSLRAASAYRVVSLEPQFTPDALRQDRADWRYATPIDVPARVRALAQGVAAGATTDYDRAVRLEQYLLSNFQYDLRVQPLSRSNDVVDSFLFERRAGYCAQFATAMAVMARAIGLPARVAAGYLPGRYNSLTGVHAVRLQDSHAWVEIKFRDNGWVPFDPTPRPDSPWPVNADPTRAAGGLQQSMRAQLKGLAVESPAEAVRNVPDLFTAPSRAGLTTLAVAFAALALGAALVVLRRRRNAVLRRSSLYSALPGETRGAVLSAYRQALHVLRRKGYPDRRSDQSPEEYAAALRLQQLAVPDELRHLSRLAANALYNPQPLDGPAAGEARRHLFGLRKLPKLAH